MTDVALIPEVLPANYAEAREATIQARQGAEMLWEGLARIVRCEGWRALSYKSFRQWAHAELDMSLQSADLYLRKTNTIMQLQEAWGTPLAEIASGVALRNGYRTKHVTTPAARSMQAATRKLMATSLLTTPDERNAAVLLRAELTRLIGDGQ